MKETITAEPSLSNWTAGYVDYGENTQHNCLILVELKALAAVCLAISLCGLVGNSLVVCFLGFHVKQNPFTIYVTNLAVLDFCMLLLFLLLMLAVLSFSTFCRHGSISLYLDFVFAAAILCQYIHINSLAFLTAMSVQQCLDVLSPSWHHHHSSKPYSGIKFLGLVLLAGLFFFHRYLGSAFARSYERVFAGLAIGGCTVLALLMLGSSLALFIKLRSGSERRPPGKLQVAVLLNVILFFALGIPFTLEVFLYLPHSYVLFPEITSLASFLLASLNSSIKPVLYFLVEGGRQSQCQGSLKVAFRRLFQEGTASKERSQEPGDTEADSSV